MVISFSSNGKLTFLIDEPHVVNVYCPAPIKYSRAGMGIATR